MLIPALDAPDFNTETWAVQQFLFDVARHWVEFDTDGSHLDVPSEIDDDAVWQEFRCAVKDTHLDAYLVGEVWGDATRWLRGDQSDDVMNFIFNRTCLGFFGGEHLDVRWRLGGYVLGRLSATQFADAVKDLLVSHAWQATLAQFNRLSSHEIPCLLTLIAGRVQALKLETLFQMCFPGAPSAYHGAEIGMEGGPDPGCRRSFSWREANWDQALLSTFRRAIRLRQTHPALRRGEFLHVNADDAHRVYAPARRLASSSTEGDSIVLVLNAGFGSYDCDLPTLGLLSDGSPFHALWGGLEAQVRHRRIRNGPLNPATAAVLTL